MHEMVCVPGNRLCMAISTDHFCFNETSGVLVIFLVEGEEHVFSNGATTHVPSDPTGRWPGKKASNSNSVTPFHYISPSPNNFIRASVNNSVQSTSTRTDLIYDVKSAADPGSHQVHAQNYAAYPASQTAPFPPSSS